MLSKKMQELADQKAKVEELEKALAAEREAQLKTLHLDLGYSTREELLAALQGAGKAGGRGPGRGGRRKAAKKKKAAKKAATGAAPAKKKRRKRAKITAEIRSGIEEAIRAGGTGSAVAKQFGVSLPTVQNIKRAAGLTRAAKAG